MLIHFDRPQCQRHKKALEYLCMIPQCQCELRLCVTCTADHCKRYGKGDFMRQENFYKKLEMETDIIAKQYSFLDQHLGKEEDSSLLASKNQQSIKMVEFVMKVVNQDKKAVYKAIDQFCFNHMGVRKKLANLQSTYNREYLQHIQHPTPLSILTNLSTNEGLDRLRKTVLNCQSTTKKYHQFLAATHKFGRNPDSFLFGLGFQNVLLRENIKKLVFMDKNEHGKIASEAEKMESPERKRNRSQHTQNSNRCQQVFSPVLNTPKKIKILTPQKRPKTSQSAGKMTD